MTNKNLQIDIVIPVHKKDLQILEYCIAAARKKIGGVRRIIVISKERYSENAEWFDESLFPFSFDSVREYVGGSVGWYFQQLLKLYAPLVIPGISENVMILDSDTVFFRRVKMLDESGLPFYNISKDKMVRRRDFDERVADHAKKVLPALAVENLPKEFQEFSGISHNMMFNREIMRDLFAKAEAHDGSGDPFYKIFLKHADHGHSASEYQIYFNFLLVFHREKMRIRKLRYKNTADINIKKYQFRFKYHYCSFHSYLRGTRSNSLRVKFGKSLRKIYAKLFCFEVWNIGIIEKNISELLTLPNSKITWLPRPKLMTFRADPFGFVTKNGEKKILFERYCYWLRGGCINSVTLESGKKISQEKKVLSGKKHLSYPYIFCDGEQKFALIESYKEKKLTLYKLSDDAALDPVCDLFSNMEIVDPSIVKHNEKWWMFFTQNNCGDDKLFLAFSQNLTDGWKMHPRNPVKIDAASARSAGEIFSHQGNLFRPAQNSTRTYGGSIVINKITELSEENFSECEEIQIHPNQLGCYPEGIHNLSKLGENLTLVDGKKRLFVFYKPLISLLRLINKKSCQLKKHS